MERRIPALDRLRGLIMVLMAIDHASFFVAGRHPAEFWGQPLPTYDGFPGFLTRELTHLAAPGFFFLLGIGVVLLSDARRRAGWSEGRIFEFLALRGATLILAQQLIENPAWFLGQTLKRVSETSPVPGTDTNVWIHFGVLAALGATLVVAGVGARLRPWVAGVLGAAAIIVTLWLTPDAGAVHDAAPWPLRVIHLPGRTGVVQVFYPWLPWCGVALLGVAFGRWIAHDRARALRAALPLGVGLLAGFVVTRLSGIGSLHGIEQPTWIGFLTVTKYPPDGPFLTLTLGVNLVLLSFLARWPAGSLTRPLEVFGGTALFFYLLHLYLYFVIGATFRDGAGYLVLYFGWALGLVILYPLCARYLAFKRTAGPDSLWRLL